MDQMKNFEIQIFIHKEEELIPFRVNSLDTIRTIMNKVSFNSPTLFLYKNTVLLNALSFAFYGITDGSHIYTTPASPKGNGSNLPVGSVSSAPTPNNHLFNNLRASSFPFSQIKKDFNAEKEKFKKIFKKKINQNSADEEESFDLSFKTYYDPLFARESAKIKDRFFQRVEGTIKCHRRLLKNFIQSNGNCFNCIEQKTKDKDKDKLEENQDET